MYNISPGLNEVRGAHDDEQQSVRPGARREARAGGRASREGARHNVCPDAPNTNYTIKHNTLIVNKRQTIRFVLMFAWDLFCEFCDYLKIAKFNTRELERKKIII